MKKIELTVEHPYPIEVVWRALTEPELMSRWLMETDFKPVVGHEFTFKGKKNSFWRGWTKCTVVRVKPLEQVQFTWQNAEKQTPTLITYRLTRTETGTKIHAANEGFDRTYGPFSGLLYRQMIKAGMKKEFTKNLPAVLATVS